MPLTDNGYSRPTYEKILEDRIQLAKDLFGEDIETSEQTPLGKFIRIGAYDLSKAYEDIEAAYYARFPNTASGTSLDHLAAFSLTSRNPATYAERVILAKGTAGTEVDEIVVCGDNRDITFHNIMPFVIEDGGTEVVVMCDTIGTVGNDEDIKHIVNPIVGVDSVELVREHDENKDGEDIESDYELRKRMQETNVSGSCNSNAIRAAIMRVQDVISAGVIENETEGNYECYVYGGENREEEIAKAIFDKKAPGTKTVTTAGDNGRTVTVIDDGGFPHEISFSYASEIPVYIRLQLEVDSTFTEESKKDVETALVEYINNLGLGKEVVLTSLYGKIYSVTGVIDVTVLELKADKDGCDEYATSNIPIDKWEYAKTYTANIEWGE